ncbi:MAG: hypothetical protein Tsb0032_09860 [Kiloniellaceae bacterium]
MDPDRKNLLRYFDDPPTTWGGLLGGLAALFLLLAGLTSWELAVPLWDWIISLMPPPMS